MTIKVKPLEWREKLGFLSAQTDFVACYSVWNVDVGRWECSLLDGSFPTAEAAQAAAQRDYETRIMNALEPVADGGDENGPLSIPYPVHEIAHNLLLAHTGSEGGCPRIDWYKLRAEISDAIVVALDKQRIRDTPPAPADAEVVERLCKALADAEPYVELCHSLMTQKDTRANVWRVLKEVRAALAAVKEEGRG